MSTSPASEHYVIGGFVPKLVPAILGAALFGVVGISFVIQFVRFRRPLYMLPVTIGACCMAIGFIVRCYMAHVGVDFSMGTYIAQTLFVLLSPCLFLAQDYMILPRLAHHLGREDSLLLSPNKVVKIFVWSDVATFLLQAAGGGLSATGDHTLTNVGKWVALIGLIAQCVSFSGFTVLWVAFGWKTLASTADTRPKSRTRRGLLSGWRVLYWTLGLTCVGILVRCVFRVAEYAGGYDGYLMTHEGYFYALDAIPLLVSIALYVVVYPPAAMQSRGGDAPLDSPGSSTPMKPLPASCA